jgi:hypothetical protein
MGSGVVSATPKISLGMAKSHPHPAMEWLPTPKPARYVHPKIFIFLKKYYFLIFSNKKKLIIEYMT